jgi:hypothetical protein
VAVRVRGEREEPGTPSVVSRAKSITGSLEIVCVGGHRVLVTGPVDPQALRDVLAVLEGASC